MFKLVKAAVTDFWYGLFKAGKKSSIQSMFSGFYFNVTWKWTFREPVRNHEYSLSGGKEFYYTSHVIQCIYLSRGKKVLIFREQDWISWEWDPILTEWDIYLLGNEIVSWVNHADEIYFHLVHSQPTQINVKKFTGLNGVLCAYSTWSFTVNAGLVAARSLEETGC